MCLRTMYVDMNAYFASVEQQLQPNLRNQPVAVVPVMCDSTCCIAASSEAKHHGIKTGTQVAAARALCPQLCIVEARPVIYVEYHHKIVQAVESCLHVDSIHSVDEMSCRLMGTEKEIHHAVGLARRVKETLRREVGECLSCSIGLAPNRFLAKVAADMQKPDGLTVITTAELPDRLFELELEDLPGIAGRMHRRLNVHGVHTVKQLSACSESKLAAIWHSVLGRIWWRQLRGHDLPEVPTRRRNVGHGRVLPPELRSDAGACGMVMRLIHKAAARLRHMQYWARQMAVGVSFFNRPSWQVRTRLGLCRDTLTLIEAFSKMWEHYPQGHKPFRVSIVLFDLEPDHNACRPLFPSEQNRIQLARAMDRINSRYGSGTIYFGGVYHTLHCAPIRIPFTSIPDLSVPL